MSEDISIRDNTMLNDTRDAIIDIIEEAQLDNVTVWGLLEEIKMDSYMSALGDVMHLDE